MDGYDDGKREDANRGDEDARKDTGDASDAGAISWPVGRVRCTRGASTPPNSI